MTDRIMLDRLFDASIPVQGEERPALLCVPETRWIHPLIRTPETRTDDRDLGLALQLLRFVKALDGEPMTLGRARALVADPAALMRAVDLRNRLFESLVDAGVARASCPSCGNEAELVLSDLLSLLRAERWPIADDRIYLAVPSLAHVWARGRRPVGVAVASGVRFVLPSARVGLATVATGGLLGKLETEEGIQRELAAWKQWAPWFQAPIEKAHWDRKLSGFRAVLRASAAVLSLDGIEGPVTPEVIEAMPVVDWYYLNQLYHLTRVVNVPGDATPALCQGCGAKFLPVTS
ncbi:MAG: hypothetical protein JWM10_2611 [Myxococcaceae bacterium]|nr:hypothetical protein [Myxococcaceae bacterium]